MSIFRIKFDKAVIVVSTHSNEPDGGLFVAEGASASVQEVSYLTHLKIKFY